ncbi:MAG: helix-turn-helix domain-containing protein [Succinivibrio sp.]|jgi:DNA-binding HxlR family transcriptional regulator|nr:helix-turn-helix domain-containing protein [Succinivibrio sp.]
MTDQLSDFHCEGGIGETGFAYTMSLISGKYTLHVLYCLLENGVVRFNEMKRYLGGITFRTLSSTLKTLEGEGLVARHEYPQIPPRVEYSLTPRGRSLEPVLMALCQWGKAHRDDQGGERP